MKCEICGEEKKGLIMIMGKFICYDCEEDLREGRYEIRIEH